MADCYDRQVIDAISALYYWRGIPRDFSWAPSEALISVCEYLESWKSPYRENPYWGKILNGGPCGYSLFLHEWTEIRHYRARGVNHLDIFDQADYYEPCHAQALLAEHRFLECVACLLEYRLSLRELVEWNPHGDQPGKDKWHGDWHVLSKELQDELSPSDQKFDPANESQARAFYSALGFEEATGQYAS